VRLAAIRRTSRGASERMRGCGWSGCRRADVRPRQH
jgi:hypothetical protein